MGFGVTHNGWDWEALPSPEMHPQINAEVGAVEYFPIPGSGGGGKWYAILGHGGMVAYNADRPEGPFSAATTNYEVLTGNCYFARFFRGANQSEVLVTHQTFSHAGHTYIAPYKHADVDSVGTLRFKWWAQNEGFKGAPLPTLGLERERKTEIQRDRKTDRETETDRERLAHLAPQLHGGFFADPVNVSEGVVLEVSSVTLPAHAPPEGKGE